MAELRPYPIGALMTRMLRELDEEDAIFDLPRRKFFLGEPDRDLSVAFHGLRAGSPLGPAAGPQSQMAQNIVLSWLGGSRVLELKTVQINDALEIPRPCIDMQTVGYNVEWSQELKLEQSLEEYVKGAMLIRVLEASGRLDPVSGFGDTVFDMSVGYDLEGIRSPRVEAFIRGMGQAGTVVERLRGEIPEALKEYRDLDFQTDLSRTLTLSTFHGCPPEEIERIIDFLLREHGLNCIVKLNPTLLGAGETRGLLHDALGYEDVRIPDSAFEQDTTWDQAVDFVGRLGETARSLGLGFGVKFTNTLVVENHRDFFPETEKAMYLSGPPLHVLAMGLVRRFRQTFGDQYPISFSAGIDRRNFADAAALGLVPITVCSDLLKPGGYARSHGYFEELLRRMAEVGAWTLDGFIILAHDHAREALDRLGLAADDPRRQACLAALDDRTAFREAAGDALYTRWVSEARLLNTETYVGALARDGRYHQRENQKLPRKIGRDLKLFDCITCDKCVPVCPNDANFTFTLPAPTLPIQKLRATPRGWITEMEGQLEIKEKHQIGTFADFCNECGNCDVFCPEDGGPYLIKPRFFGSLFHWKTFATLDGFHLGCAGGHSVLHGRCEGHDYCLDVSENATVFTGPGFSVRTTGDAIEVVADPGIQEIDLTWREIMNQLRRGLEGTLSYVGLLADSVRALKHAGR